MEWRMMRYYSNLCVVGSWRKRRRKNLNRNRRNRRKLNERNERKANLRERVDGRRESKSEEGVSSRE